jgi:hypothetical protein
VTEPGTGSSRGSSPRLGKGRETGFDSRVKKELK